MKKCVEQAKYYGFFTGTEMPQKLQKCNRRVTLAFLLPTLALEEPTFSMFSMLQMQLWETFRQATRM